MIPEAALLGHFESVKRRGDGEWMALCPAHGDRNPSLHITRREDRWLLCCHAGCDTDDVLAAAGLTFLDLAERDNPFTGAAAPSRPVVTYRYVDADGSLLYEVLRWHPKRFSQRAADGTASLKGVERVPYRLPELLAGVKAGERVHVAEGEKDVEAIRAAGGVATCNSGGAGAVAQWGTPAFQDHLDGAEVVVVADRDDAGRKHAAEVASHLDGVAASVTVVEAAQGKDAADHLSAGLGLAEFVEPRPEPAANEAANEAGPLAGRRTDLVRLLAEPAKPTPWRVEGLVADATLTILAGESTAGKSFLAQALCLGISSGRPVAGLPCTRGRALYVDAEMGWYQFVDRMRPAGLTGREFDHIDATGLDLSRHGGLNAFAEEIGRRAYNLVIFDSLRRLAPSRSENDSDDMAPTVGAFTTLARETGAAVVLIHHAGKDGMARGSSAIRDQCDALFVVVKDGGARRLTCREGGGKMRYAAEPEDVWLTVDPVSGGVSLSAPGAPALSTPKAPQREETKDAILALLPVKSKREAARTLGKPYGDTTFMAAWEELQDEGLIARNDGVWGGGIPIRVPRGRQGDTTPQTAEIAASSSPPQETLGEIVDAEVVTDRCTLCGESRPDVICNVPRCPRMEAP